MQCWSVCPKFSFLYLSYQFFRFPGQEHVAGNTKIPSIMYYDRHGRMMAAGAEADGASVLAQAEDEGWMKIELWVLIRKETIHYCLADVCGVYPLLWGTLDVAWPWPYTHWFMYIREVNRRNSLFWTSGLNFVFVLNPWHSKWTACVCLHFPEGSRQ